MTQEDYRTLQAYVRQIADGFGLKDWEIVVESVHADGPVDAACYTRNGRKYARFRYSPDVREWPATKLLHVTLHELLHCHMAGVQDYVEEQLAVRGTPAFAAYEKCNEYAIDGVAVAVANRGAFAAIQW